MITRLNIPTPFSTMRLIFSVYLEYSHEARSKYVLVGSPVLPEVTEDSSIERSKPSAIRSVS